MAKLYFKYGAMGSSKTAQALITKFNYEERGMQVWLLKPAIDTRDGEEYLQSRIGLRQKADVLTTEDNVWQAFAQKKQEMGAIDVIIVDECQFLTAKQVEDLRDIVCDEEIPVMCFGLRTDFQTKMFEGSRRLLELADSISEIKIICSCGAKAIVNARIDESGKVMTEGDQILIGGNDRYEAMCYRCWRKKILTQQAEEKEIAKGVEQK